MARQMNSWRAISAATGLAVARVRSRPSRGLVAGVGIAIALAALFVTVAAPSIAGDVALRQSLQALPPAERTITVAATIGGFSPTAVTEIDTIIRRELHVAGLGPVRNELEYRALAAADGTVFRLAGVDGLSAVVTLQTGRMPQECTPQHCEVLIIAPATTLALQPDIGIEIVGQAQLVDTTLLSGTFAPDAGEIVLLGDGFTPVGAIAPLDLIGRSAGWVSAIDPTVLRTRDINRLFSAAARTRAGITSTIVTVSLPDKALKAARLRARAASNRAVLAAAQGVVLLVAFVMLAAAGGRREHGAARDLLRRRGANRAALHWFTLCEAAWPMAIGAVVGVPLGSLVVRWLANRNNIDAADAIATTFSNGAARLVIGTLVLLAVVALILAAPAGEPRPRRWWQPTAADLLGAGALAMAAFAVARGNTSVATLVGDGDPLLALLPMLATLAVAWIALRVIPVLMRLGVRALGRRAPLARVALGENGRGALLPLATAAFLCAATMLGVFALGYRSTLQRGAHDQAAFVVPYDAIVREGPQLVRPATVAPPGGWATLTAGGTSTAVLRRGVAVRSKTLESLDVTVLGLDPATLTSLRGWRSDFGDAPAVLARQITPAQAPPALGTPLPADATELLVAGSGDLDITAVYAIVARADGTWHEATATYSVTTPGQVRVTLEPGDAGGRLIGFRVGQRGEASDRFQHKTGEGATDANTFTSSLTLDEVRAGDSVVPLDWASLASPDAVVTTAGTGVQINLRLQGSSALILPASNGEEPIAAIVDPTTAASANAGIVSIDVTGGKRRALRVAAIANRFPGAPAHFAIVDLATAQQSFDLLDPGLGTPTEEWLASPSPAVLTDALAHADFADVVVQHRAALQEALDSDPLATFTLALFGAAALLAALLAVAATYLSTLSSATAQAPLHRALVAEGVRARALSRMVSVGALALVISALLVGAAGAVVLLRVVTRVIAVTAASTVPVPPLVTVLEPGLALAALAGALALAALAALAAARTARQVAHSDVMREFG